MTRNPRLGRAFGNLTLRKDEAGLREQSVVNVAQIFTVDRSKLEGRVGRLSRRRFGQVLDGVHSPLRPIDIQRAALE